VKERKLLLGTCLEEGFFAGLAGTTFSLALTPEHSFHKAMLEMKENRELIQQELERGFGRRLAFQCVVRDAGPERVEHRARVDRAVREALAGDSLVRRIVDLFDGEIVETPSPRAGGEPATPGEAATGKGKP
jgi:hypothetical protein